ncbi:hypothetical protein D3C81_1268870 [compost metagenome]
MVVHHFEEALEGRAVVQVLARVDLEAQVHAAGVEGIQNGAPAATEFGERFFHQTWRTLRPGIEIRPGQCAGKRGMRRQSQSLAGLGGQQQLLHRPGLAGGRITTFVRRCESVEQAVVGGVDGDQLPLQVGGQFGDLQAMSGQHAGDVVAVRLAACSLGQIEQAGSAGWYLYARIAQARGPLCQRVEPIKRRCVADELRQEKRRTLERLQRDSPRCNRLHLS